MEIGERNDSNPIAYNNAADFIAETLQESGLVPYEEELGDNYNTEILLLNIME